MAPWRGRRPALPRPADCGAARPGRRPARQGAAAVAADDQRPCQLAGRRTESGWRHCGSRHCGSRHCGWRLGRLHPRELQALRSRAACGACWPWPQRCGWHCPGWHCPGWHCPGRSYPGGRRLGWSSLDARLPAGRSAAQTPAVQSRAVQTPAGRTKAGLTDPHSAVADPAADGLATTRHRSRRGLALGAGAPGRALALRRGHRMPGAHASPPEPDPAGLTACAAGAAPEVWCPSGEFAPPCTPGPRPRRDLHPVPAVSSCRCLDPLGSAQPGRRCPRVRRELSRCRPLGAAGQQPELRPRRLQRDRQPAAESCQPTAPRAPA